MIKYYKWMLIFFGMILSIHTVKAVCTRTAAPTITGSTDMGTVIVSPNLAVGAIIAQQVFSIPGNASQTFLNCDNGTEVNADVVMGIVSASDATLYSTNIPGVSIRFNRNKRDYPYIYTASGATSLGDSNITVTLIKTAEIVGSGPLTAGTYTQFGYRPVNNPMMSTYMNANGTTIIAPSCTISNSSSSSVYLESISRNKLTGGIGLTAGETPISINLLCNGGSSVSSGFDNINLTFSGEIPSGLDASYGVLANTSASGAKGIGIQVLETGSKKPLIFNKTYVAGSLASTQNGYLGYLGYLVSQNYIARYYRYGTQITSGDVEAKMLYNITYN
ncbi:fimbrial protein [Utexia brackfieldae]|uniref:fimbrial protein n=1 Tax=Utexia brackfieldae TaxID=3074108 RepID=UPI00370D3BD6